MDRGVALLGLAVGGSVMTTLVPPGERPGGGWPETMTPFRVAADIVDILEARWVEAGRPPLVGVAMAAEGEERRGRVTFESHPGEVLEAAPIMEALDTSRVHLLSSGVASALGVSQMADADRVLICPGVSEPGAAICVIAPESALTASFAIETPRGEWIAGRSEGRRLDVAPEGDRERWVTQVLAGEGRRTAADKLCRGGLTAIHGVVAGLDRPTERLGAFEICDLAKAGDANAMEAVSIFCGWLGDFARQMATAMAAEGGVYVAGPLLQRLEDVIDLGRFERRFRPEGSADAWLARTPVWRPTSSTALHGLSTLFSASDARRASNGVLMLDC